MISNEEICKRFDVLYNNITSFQAPGLDKYEKSVFWNKAQLEVLKNHLNPKGNKYGEGFDHSSKRQIDFSSITVTKKFFIYPYINQGSLSANSNRLTTVQIKLVDKETGKEQVLSDETDSEQTGSGRTDKVSEVASVKLDFSKILSIINETLVVNKDEELEEYRDQIDKQAIHRTDALSTEQFAEAIASGLRGDVDEDGKVNIADVTALIDYLLGHQWVTNPVPISKLYGYYCPAGKQLTVVPINATEYDTLMSRPYKYPLKSQVWRLFSDSCVEVIVPQGQVPTVYTIRYIKTPSEVDLSDETKTCELPDMLVDEVLQRAVELAKNSWEGNLETTKALGERSE